MWIDSNALEVASKMGVTFGTGCRCGKEILEEINDIAHERGTGESCADKSSQENGEMDLNNV